MVTQILFSLFNRGVIELAWLRRLFQKSNFLQKLRHMPLQCIVKDASKTLVTQDYYIIIHLIQRTIKMSQSCHILVKVSANTLK